MIDRRSFLAAAMAAPFAAPAAARSVAGPDMTMWKDPSCGCCGDWAARMESELGGRMRIVAASDMEEVKRLRGVPNDLRSCHTAVVNGLTVEGHVPPADVMRLVRERPSGIAGLAVPGMPLGSPGMDIGHDRRQPYQVIAFGPGNRRMVWARHG